MNLSSNRSTEKPVSAIPLFKGEGIVTALQILQNQELKEHTTKVPALLICIVGKVVLRMKKGLKKHLKVVNM